MSNSRASLVGIAILAVVGAACTTDTSLGQSGAGGAPTGTGGVTAGGGAIGSGAIPGGTGGTSTGGTSSVGVGGTGGQGAPEARDAGAPDRSISTDSGPLTSDAAMGIATDGSTDASASCPANEPKVGATCTASGLTCEYGTGACCGHGYTCTGGAWQQLLVPCPCPAPGTGGAGGGLGGASGTGGQPGTGGSRIDGGSGGSGAGGKPCRRLPGDDATCVAQYQRSLAYFCEVTAQPPSSDCVAYNPINSGDSYCCPGQYSNCPAQRPTPGTGCPTTMVGTTCTYGGDLDPTCRTSATCQSGTESYPTWQVPAVTCNSPTPPAGCATKPSPGQACSSHGLACRYATGDYCECTGCNSESPTCPITPPPDAWYCWAPPADPCPTTAPEVGSACTLSASVRCRYRCDLILACSAQGKWGRSADVCPECNAPDTPIATPSGNRPIASLAAGDLVYSIHQGQVSVVPIAETGRKWQRDHHVVRLQLATGAVLHISPTHPTADGRTLGDLNAEDRLDGVRIVSAALVPFLHSHTYDILPASDTGTYYAGGVLIGSTLAPTQRIAAVPSPTCGLVAGR